MSLRDSWRNTGLSFGLLSSFISSFLSHAYWKTTLGVVEWGHGCTRQGCQGGPMAPWTEHGWVEQGTGRSGGIELDH